VWINDPDTISDKYLYSTSGLIHPQETAGLFFSDNYALEDTFYGGVPEISIDGGHSKTFLQPVGSDWQRRVIGDE
jgi:hypothetical protein